MAFVVGRVAWWIRRRIKPDPSAIEREWGFLAQINQLEIRTSWLTLPIRMVSSNTCSMTSVFLLRCTRAPENVFCLHFPWAGWNWMRKINLNIWSRFNRSREQQYIGNCHTTLSWLSKSIKSLIEVENNGALDMWSGLQSYKYQSLGDFTARSMGNVLWGTMSVQYMFPLCAFENEPKHGSHLPLLLTFNQSRNRKSWELHILFQGVSFRMLNDIPWNNMSILSFYFFFLSIPSEDLLILYRYYLQAAALYMIYTSNMKRYA